MASGRQWANPANDALVASDSGVALVAGRDTGGVGAGAVAVKDVSRPRTDGMTFRDMCFAIELVL